MDILDMLKKVAGELDELGHFEHANELDEIIAAAVQADAVEKLASGTNN